MSPEGRKGLKQAFPRRLMHFGTTNDCAVPLAVKSVFTPSTINVSIWGDNRPLGESADRPKRPLELQVAAGFMGCAKGVVAPEPIAGLFGKTM